MSDLENRHPRAVGAARQKRPRGARIGVICVLAAALLALVGTADAAEPEIPPVVVAGPASAVAGGYTLTGTIYTYALDTHYHFEYGTGTGYGTSVPVPDADAGTDPVVQVSQTITGLAPSTTYHYRIVASNSKGPGSSADQTFTTSADPAAAPAPPSASPGPSPGPSQTPTAKQLKLKRVKVEGRWVLASPTGRTLYSLSVERKGRFVCTKASGCLGLWHPLMAPRGVMPTGPVALATIKRPEGGLQVTFRGRPLYTYALDTKPGQAQGDGAKDVGTWHPATIAG